MAPEVDKSSRPIERVAVVGAGAVGAYYGGRLAQHGNDVHFLMRSDYEAVRERGLFLHSTVSEAGHAHLHPVNAWRDTAAIGPVDLVIIALKATANAALDGLIPPLLHDHTALLTLQNGLGSDDYLAERFGAERVLGGLCFVCLNRVAPGEIRHIDHGLITLGEFGRVPEARTRWLCDEFQRCGVPCALVDDLAEARWRKLVWNVPFNGLAIAAGGIDVARILADDTLFSRTRRLMDEVIAGAAALGHTIEPSFADEMIARTRTMGAYQPSSLIDYLAGREVEVEAIWGEPLRRARAAGADLPELEKLHAEVSAACGKCD